MSRFIAIAVAIALCASAAWAGPAEGYECNTELGVLSPTVQNMSVSPLMSVADEVPTAPGALAPLRSLPEFSKIDCERMAYSDWQNVADNVISLDGYKFSKDPQLAADQRILMRNSLISAAYAKLLRWGIDRRSESGGNMQFFWLGAAAHGSSEVGGIMRQSYIDVLHDRDQAKPSLKAQLANLSTIWGMTSRTASAITGYKGQQILETLGRGNKAIFEDIYWQHLVVAYCGTGTLTRLQKERLASVHAQSDKDIIQHSIDAWHLIETGVRRTPTADLDLVTRGTLGILQIEQQDVLQPLVYSGTMASIAGRIFNDQVHVPWSRPGFTFPSFVDYASSHNLTPNFADYNSRWPYLRDAVTAFVSHVNEDAKSTLEDMGEVLHDSRNFIYGAASAFEGD